MADDDQNNDEYQFADLDVLGSEQDAASLPEDEPFEGSNEGVSSPPGRGRLSQLDPKVIKLIKKGVIAVAALVFVLLAYKMITSIFSSKSTTKKTAPVVKVASAPKTSQMPMPIHTSTPVTTTATGVDGKLSALKQEQSRIENELSSIRTQMGAITQSMSDMSTKMADVKQTMLVLNERLEQQSNQMGRLQSMNRAKRVSASKPRSRQTPAAEKPTYAIQAIIPGRAWLMSSQGKTLTVSRGSVVPGYGTVRLINAKVGRVFTSSGRVIQFSQADS